MSLIYALEKIFNPTHIIEEETLDGYLEIFKDFFIESEKFLGEHHFRDTFMFAINNIKNTIKTKNIDHFKYNWEQLNDMIGYEYFIYAEYIKLSIEYIQEILREYNYVIDTNKTNGSYIKK